MTRPQCIYLTKFADSIIGKDYRVGLGTNFSEITVYGLDFIVSQQERLKPHEPGQLFEPSDIIISQIHTLKLVICRRQILQVRYFVASQVDVELIQRVEVLLGATYQVGVQSHLFDF